MSPQLRPATFASGRSSLLSITCSNRYRYISTSYGPSGALRAKVGRTANPGRIKKSINSTQPRQQRRWITERERPLPTKAQPTTAGVDGSSGRGQDTTTAQEQGRLGPNQEQQPHVSEEAAAIDNAMGKEGPDLEQGTPVQEILEKSPQGTKEKLPKVMQEEMKNRQSPPAGAAPAAGSVGQSRSYSTSAQRREGDSMGSVPTISSSGSSLPPSMIKNFKDIPHELAGEGHKFGMPQKPLLRTDHLKRRYDPVLDQFTKALMRSGKLGFAQRTVEKILDTLRTAPSPQQKSNRPGQALLPSAGFINLLPLSPIKYLTAVFDSVAPLIRIRQQKGIAGGGQSLPIPMPIPLQLRRRMAIKWILEGADKRSEPQLADRVAREIINVAEGTSSAWEKRNAVHKSAVTARVNVKVLTNRK